MAVKELKKIYKEMMLKGVFFQREVQKKDSCDPRQKNFKKKKMLVNI